MMSVRLSLCVVVSALAVALSGQALARDLPPIKTVGVASDVGDKIALTHIGFMVFSNKRSEAEFPDWQLDAFIAGEIEAALKQRYELRAVTFAKGSIAPDLSPQLFGHPSPDENLRDHATPEGGTPVDAYVAVWPRSAQVFSTNQYVTGVGLLTRGGRASIYAALAVTLVDGRTFEEIDFCWPRIKDGDIDNMRAREDLEDVESFDAMTPEQKQGLQQGLKDLVRDGLSYCLRDLKLTP